MAPNKVENGLVVGIQYTLKLDDGELVDESVAGEPLLYLHGANNIIPGLEQALTGLAVGDKKSVTVKPDDGYGEYEDEAVETLPRAAFPDDVELEEGLVLAVRDETGEVYEAIVAEFDDNEVTLDFNHPLAGETLNFDVEIVEIREATAEELDHGHPHFEGDGHSH